MSHTGQARHLFFFFFKSYNTCLQGCRSGVLTFLLFQFLLISSVSLRCSRLHEAFLQPLTLSHVPCHTRLANACLPRWLISLLSTLAVPVTSLRCPAAPEQVWVLSHRSSIRPNTTQTRANEDAGNGPPLLFPEVLCRRGARRRRFHPRAQGAGQRGLQVYSWEREVRLLQNLPLQNV